jgi:enoyl-CoA hydratase/carnithine racemase
MGITREVSNSVSTIWMDFDHSNLMTYERLQEIIKIHREADEDPETRVIVTRSKRPGVFSMGFDPKYIVETEASKRKEIFRGISQLIEAFLSLKRPHISVIDGPALAGGAVLAIVSDYRLFEKEAGKISFSEAKLGLALPDALIEVISNFVNPGFLREMTIGKNVSADLALTQGLANWVSSSAELEEKLALECSKLARLSPYVLEVTKSHINKCALEMARKLLESFEQYEVFMGDEFLGEGLKSLVEQRKPNFLK